MSPVLVVGWGVPAQSSSPSDLPRPHQRPGLLLSAMTPPDKRETNHTSGTSSRVYTRRSMGWWRRAGDSRDWWVPPCLPCLPCPLVKTYQPRRGLSVQLQSARRRQSGRGRQEAGGAKMRTRGAATHVVHVPRVPPAQTDRFSSGGLDLGCSSFPPRCCALVMMMIAVLGDR